MDKNTETIKNFLTEMKNQNNRGTREPFYYVIRDFVKTLAPENCGEFVEYMNKYDSSFILTEDEYEEDGLCTQNDFYRVETKKTETKRGVFLTESDAINHLEENSHHYTKEAHIYIEHAWRAPQMEAFFKALFMYFDINKKR